MTDKQPEALRVAEYLENDMPPFSEYAINCAAALLRTQHAAIERKAALLRKCLKHVASNITRDGCEAEELYDAIQQELSKQ